jgi:hypothetical protein
MSTVFRTFSSSCIPVFVLLLIGLGLASTAPVRAQESAGSEELPLQEGAWALQFDVGQNFTLDSFLGSTISAKRHTSAARAWQVGLTLGASVVSRETEQVSSSTVDQQTVEVTARYLAYPLLGEQDAESIQLYLGAGPSLDFRRTSEESVTNWRWGIGVSGTIGVEWFVHPRIGLNGAYQSTLRYGRIRREPEDEDTPSQTTNRFDLRAGGARFGVSVYF